MKAYLDAGALLPMLIAEPGSAAVDVFVEAPPDELVVSEFAAAEVASAMSRLVRADRLSADDAVARLADFDAWRTAATDDVEPNAADVRLAHVYVRRIELMLRTSDALHAAICRRADLELITLDRRLATPEPWVSLPGCLHPNRRGAPGADLGTGPALGRSSVHAQTRFARPTPQVSFLNPNSAPS